MSELEKITKVLKQNKSALARDFNVKKIGVFGSYARGQAKRRSDIDILVEFSQTPGLIDYIRTENNLSGLLKRRVDLVMKDALKPAIGKRILREVVYV